MRKKRRSPGSLTADFSSVQCPTFQKASQSKLILQRTPFLDESKSSDSVYKKMLKDRLGCDDWRGARRALNGVSSSLVPPVVGLGGLG